MNKKSFKGKSDTGKSESDFWPPTTDTLIMRLASDTPEAWEYFFERYEEAIRYCIFYHLCSLRLCSRSYSKDIIYERSSDYLGITFKRIREKFSTYFNNRQQQNNILFRKCLTTFIKQSINEDLAKTKSAVEVPSTTMRRHSEEGKEYSSIPFEPDLHSTPIFNETDIISDQAWYKALYKQALAACRKFPTDNTKERTVMDLLIKKWQAILDEWVISQDENPSIGFLDDADTPKLNNSQIAKSAKCTPQYVSQIKNKLKLTMLTMFERYGDDGVWFATRREYQTITAMLSKHKHFKNKGSRHER